MPVTTAVREQTLAAAPDAAEAILSAVVFGARDFLNRPDWDAVLVDFLERLGRATRSSQVRLFENGPVAPGEDLTASLTAEWKAEGVTAGSPMEELQRISYVSVGLARWETELAEGRIVSGATSEFPAAEQPMLASQSIVSVAVVPVFVGPRWFGFLGLADCDFSRHWSDAEVNALLGAAAILGAAHARRELETRVAASTTQEQLAAAIADALSTTGVRIDGILDLCCDSIASHLAAKQVRIWTTDEKTGDLVLRARFGQLPGDDVAPGDHALAEIARVQELRVWRDGIPELWPGSTDALHRAGFRGGVGHPLCIKGRTVGVMIVLFEHAPADSVADAMTAISSEIALAIEHSHARFALHRSEDRYKRLFEATVEGICIHDGQRLLDVNPVLAGMVGWDLDGVLGRSPFEFIHPRHHEVVTARMLANYTGAYEAEFVRRDGSVFPVEIKGRDFYVDGERLRMTSVRDITERKDAERAMVRLAEEHAAREAAEATRRRAEFLRDASTLLASSFDTTTALTQLARLSVPFMAHACRVALMEDGELRLVAHVTDAPDAEAEISQRAPLQLPDEASTGEIAEDGAVIIMPIRFGGRPMGVIEFTAPTDRPVYALEDIGLAQELAGRAAVSIQSAQSYHDAQAATRARDEMLAVVAHDLRNPLNTIYMGSSLALELTADQPPTPARTQLEVILRSANHMNRLIQDLLDATRVQSGQLTLEKALTDPRAIVDEAIELLGPLASNAGISLESHQEVDGEMVLVDRMRIIQVLSNLIGNAVKFTPRGGHIVLGCSAADGSVRFHVTDDGPGIPADQLPHIFGRFWQARRADQRGLGLGLAIARGVVESHGGRIWVESTLGVGSSFRFTVGPPTDP